MAPDFDVAVVGAGAAGIAAARRVAAAGQSVILIEASQRVGGRAYTQNIAGMPLDLGCGWLHSAERNPMVDVAEASGFSVDRMTSAWRSQYRDLGFSLQERRAAGEAWSALQHRFSDNPPASDRGADALEPDGRWNGYLETVSGFMNGVGLAGLSIRDYLAYDDASTDTNWRIRHGYGALVAAQLPDIPVKLATPVTAIDHSGATVKLQTRNGMVVARSAVLAVPTTVLASDAIGFTPRIDTHRHAAAQLPLGLADKMYLMLGKGHGLEADTHLLGNPASSCTGSYYIMPFGHPVIECFFGGGCAEELERLGPVGTFDFAVNELASLLGNRIRETLKFLVASQWRHIDGINGSYSHALPGQAHCRSLLAAPIDGRLFFAGEATHPTDFSTAHGAWESGLRAAEEALACLARS